MASSAPNTMVKLKSTSDQRYQLLKLQNCDPAQSFTDGRISCRDGYILVHYGVLMAGADPLSLPMFMDSLYYEEPNLRTVDAKDWTVKEMSTVVFLFYLEKSRVTFHENNGADYFQGQLKDRLAALCANTTQVFSLIPLLLQNVRGLKRNRLLAKMSDSLDGMTLRFTRTDGHGKDEGDYLISTDGNITPALSSEPTPPLAAASSNDANGIGRAPENLYVPSPIMCSTSIDYERNPFHSNSLSTGNNINGVADESSRNNRMRRRSEAEADRENIASNPNKRSRRIENGFTDAPSPNRSRGRPLAPLINIIPSPPVSQSHNSHQGPRHACKINRCGLDFDDVIVFLAHLNHDHKLFKSKHFRLRKVPQCLICNSRSKQITEMLQASPEDFAKHISECLQRKKQELGPKWEPDFQRQVKRYPQNYTSPTPGWYEELEDSPTSFTEEDYIHRKNKCDRIMRDNIIDNVDDISSDGESESDDPDPEECVADISESPSNTEDEDELCLQIVTEDIARRILNP